MKNSSKKKSPSKKPRINNTKINRDLKKVKSESVKTKLIELKETKKKIALRQQQKLQTKIKVKTKEKGYFKGQLTELTVKALLRVYPNTLTKKKLAKNFKISNTTLNKVLKNKKVTLNTLKKISSGINSILDVNKALKISLVAEHLKRYKTISEKKLKSIDKQVKKHSKEFESLLDKEYLFFRIQYSNSKNQGINENRK
jgi:predicted transcriptional regulator